MLPCLSETLNKAITVQNRHLRRGFASIVSQVITPALVVVLLCSSLRAFAEDWVGVASMRIQRYCPCAVTLPDGRILVAGGYSDGGDHDFGKLSSVEVLNPTTGAWSYVAPMNVTRGLFAMVVLNGKVYAMGGYDRPRVRRTLEVYDPSTNTWTLLASMQTARMAFSAATSNGKIYVMGGSDDTGQLLGTVEEYNPSTDTWRYVASLNTARSGSAATTTSDGKVYCCGGYVSGTGVTAAELKSVEVYDPTNDTWSFVASMQVARDGGAATLGADGRIYVAGGWKDLQTDISKSVEAYDPVANTWTYIPSMITKRSNLALATGNDGRLYAMGGNSGSQSLITVEAYDTQATKISFLYPTLTTRYFETKPLDVTVTNTTFGTGIGSLDITFTLDGVLLGTATTDSTGRATLNQYIDTGLALGARTLVVSYAGSTLNHASSASNTLTINKASTSISVQSPFGVFGQTVSVIAQLHRPFDNTNIAGKTLSFSIGGTSIGSATTDSNGVATLSYTIDTPAQGGANNLVVSFAGDSVYTSSTRTGTLTVNTITSSLSLSNATGLLGQTIIFQAQFKRPLDNTGISGKSITFSVDGNSVGSATTNASGVATLSYKVDEPLSIGSHTLKVGFAGDTGYSASSRSGTLTVQQANTLVQQWNTNIKAGRTSNIIAKLIRTSDNQVLSGKVVRFFVNNVEVGSATTNGSGVATFSYTASLSVGTYPMKAVFDGDANYIGSQYTGANLTVTP